MYLSQNYVAHSSTMLMHFWFLYSCHSLAVLLKTWSKVKQWLPMHIQKKTQHLGCVCVCMQVLSYFHFLWGPIGREDIFTKWGHFVQSAPLWMAVWGLGLILMAEVRVTFGWGFMGSVCSSARPIFSCSWMHWVSEGPQKCSSTNVCAVKSSKLLPSTDLGRLTAGQLFISYLSMHELMLMFPEEYHSPVQYITCSLKSATGVLRKTKVTVFFACI